MAVLAGNRVGAVITCDSADNAFTAEVETDISVAENRPGADGDYIAIGRITKVGAPLAGLTTVAFRCIATIWNMRCK